MPLFLRRKAGTWCHFSSALPAASARGANASADAVAAPQESSTPQPLHQGGKEPRKLLGNNRQPKLVVALGRFASPGNGCLARRQARQTPSRTSAPAAPTVGQRSGSLQAHQRPQTGQLRPAHKRQLQSSAGAAPVRRTHPCNKQQPKPQPASTAPTADPSTERKDGKRAHTLH